MHIQSTAIADILKLTPKKHEDHRVSFAEGFMAEAAFESGFEKKVQRYHENRHWWQGKAE